MKLYVYGLSDEVTPAMIESIRGIGDAAPQLLQFGGFAAVASEFAGERIPLTRANVEAHNRVNLHLLAHTTPLPFRFGTLAARPQLDSYISAHADALADALERVRGAVEMSVKIMWDVEAERDDAGSGAATAAAAAGDASRGTGTAFLAAKQRELAGEAALKERAEEIRARLAAAVAGAVRDERVLVNSSHALVVRAAHLVERGRLDEYRKRLRALREEQPDRWRFMTSGAWPPYSFSEG